jgi:hypothetical protein
VIECLPNKCKALSSKLQYLEKSVAFLYTNSELTEKEIRKTIPFTIILKKKKPLE